MADPTPARGRPPRVTADRLRRALLEIEGEVPTMASLARQLGVGVATLYGHVRGQDALHRLAADVAFDAWELPPAAAGTHWAEWALAYARDARRMTERYPAVKGSRPLAGGQLRYVERVLARLIDLGLGEREALQVFEQLALLILGVGAQLEATRLEVETSGLDLWGLFQEAVASHPEPLPVLGSLTPKDVPDLDRAFDALVWSALTAIARRRGEVLPAKLRTRGA